MDETKLDKFKNGIVNSLGFIMVAGIVAIFFVKNFVDISQTGKQVSEIIADGIFALLFGWSIKTLLGYQGILSGLQSKPMRQTSTAHGDSVKKIEPYLPFLPKFCDKENAVLRIRKRKLILSREYLDYDDVFCTDSKKLQKVIEEKLQQLDIGAVINDGSIRYRLNRRKIAWLKTRKRKAIMRCVRKANRVHITELSQSALTTDGGNGSDPFKFAGPLGKHATKKSIFALPISIVFAVVLGYYGYKLVDNPDWATVVGGLIQIGSLLAVGALQFLKEYIYVTDTYRKSTIRKIDIIDQFFAEVTSNNGDFKVPEEIIKTAKICEVAKNG